MRLNIYCQLLISVFHLKKSKTLSAKVHQILKVVKENGLIKKFQKPLTIRGDDASPKKLPSIIEMQDKYRQVQHNDHQGMTPKLYVREFTFERSQQRGKKIWRSKPQKEVIQDKGNGVAFNLPPREYSNEKVGQKWNQ